MNESAVRPGGTAATTLPPSPSEPRSKGPRRWVDLATEYVYRLASSTLATPKVAVGISLAGIAVVMLVGILSPNYNTLDSNQTDGTVSSIVLPLSGHLFRLIHPWWIAPVIMYLAVVLQCVGLAGLLWANSRGWQPNPRHLFIGACVIVGIMVNITPVGSSDMASYAAYGHMANRGIDPYATGLLSGPRSLGPGNAYYQAVAFPWRTTPSVYGPLGTWVQQLAAWIGGNDSPTITVYFLMLFNGLVFLGVGYFLLKTADDPIRATLMWVANPVLIQQLVAGGHLDTYTAAATVVGVQIARSGDRGRRYLLVGIAVGVACCFKVNAGLVGVGIGFALLMRREWLNLLWLAVGGIGTTVLFYTYYGLHSLTQIFAASNLVASPSIWRGIQLTTTWVFGLFGHQELGQTLSTDLAAYTWPILMVVLAVFMYKRFSSDQPAVVIVPFVLCFAWVIVAPWNLPWYSAVAWVILALVPRNPMTRWLTLVTVFLALSHGSGGGPVSLNGPN